MRHAPDNPSAARLRPSGVGLVCYGPEIAAAISLAPRVEIWDLEPTGTPTRVRAVRRLDASQAAGLVHLRRGLVEDGNFDWNTTVGIERPPAADWRVAIAFFPEAAGARPVAVIALAFDPQGRGAATVPQRPGWVALGRIAKGLRTWLDATRAGADKPVNSGAAHGPADRETPEKGR